MRSGWTILLGFVLGGVLDLSGPLPAAAAAIGPERGEVAARGGQTDLLIAPAPRAAARPAVLTNPDFEDGGGTDSPADWARDAFRLETAELTWDATAVHGGTRSVRIELATANDARWVQSVAVIPNTGYRFCGWVKTLAVADSADGVNAGANLSVIGGFEYHGLVGTHDWTQVCLTFDSGSRSEVILAARLGMYSGTTTGIAWFDDLTLEELPPVPPTVRTVYVVPADRVPRLDYRSVIEQAMTNLQSWYAAELGGTTFRLREPVVEVLQSSHDSAWFTGDGEFATLFNTAAAEAWALAGEGGFDDPTSRWVIYIDVSPLAGQCGGCGVAGVAVLAKGDLQGLAGEPRIEAEFTEYSPVCRYVGGLGHELAHAFGLPHPAVCDNGEPACFEGDAPPANSLLYTGYILYPRTYFLPEQSAALLVSPFFVPALAVEEWVDCQLITPCGPGAGSCNGVCSPRDEAAPMALLYNGSFEDCLYSTEGKPQAWDRRSANPTAATLTWDETVAHAGARSVRIQHDTPNRSRWIQSVPVVPQRQYRLCGWIKTTDVRAFGGDGGANLSLEESAMHAGIDGTTDWREVCLPFDSGSNTTVTVAAQLGALEGAATGTAWFDTVRLERIDSASCVGDCNGDGSVEINELIIGVGIALSSAPPTACPAFDRDGNGAVGIDELTAAVNNSLNGCAEALLTPG